MLYSLLVPTRNRVETASILIREMVGRMDEDCEIVVQDCGTEGLLPGALGEIMSHPRLSYAHTGRAVSMTDNWNAGMARCLGEFVTVIGDDDIVAPSVCQAARWMRRRNLDAIAGGDYGGYYWPSFPDASKAGRYKMRRYTGRDMVLDCKRLHCDALQKFGHDTSFVSVLPSVYRGIVRRSRVERMARRPGVFFSTTIPDLYSNHYLAATLEKICWVDFPLVISGACSQSNSGIIHAKGYAQGASAHFQEYSTSELTDYAPIGNVLVGRILDVVIQALQDARQEKLLELIDFAAVYTTVIARDPSLLAKNLSRYFRASALLGRSRVGAAAALATQIAGRALGKLRPQLADKGSPGLVEIPPICEEFTNVRNVVELITRQQHVLQALNVRAPWERPAADAA